MSSDSMFDLKGPAPGFSNSKPETREERLRRISHLSQIHRRLLDAGEGLLQFYCTFREDKVNLDLAAMAYTRAREYLRLAYSYDDVIRDLQLGVKNPDLGTRRRELGTMLKILRRRIQDREERQGGL